MQFDAIILTGGRALRMGGVSKGNLTRSGRSLLALSLDAARLAHRTVIVGESCEVSDVRVVREDPPFAGPVAAIATGLGELGTDASEFVLILACDMPDASDAIPLMLEALSGNGPREGVIAVDEGGNEQYLLAVYSVDALRDRIAQTTVQGASVREVIRTLDLARVRAPGGSARDVDTWRDAELLSVTKGGIPDER